MPRRPLVWLLLLTALVAPARGSDVRVVGQIVGPRGDLLVDGWRVEATLVRNDPDRGRLPVVHYAAPDPRLGAFALPTLGARRASLRALHTSGLESRRIEVDLVGATDDVPVTLAYDGPAPEDCIVVTASVAGGPGAPSLEAARARAVRGDGAEFPFSALACPWMELRGAWVARGLRPGAYTVEYRDPRFRRAVLTGVTTGTSTALRLSGDAGLRVELAGSSWAREPFGVALSRGGGSPREVVQLPSSRGSEDVLVLADLFPGDHVLDLVFANRPARRVEVAALAAGERRTVSVSLPPPVVVEGCLVASGGAPLAMASVRLHGPPDADVARLRRFMGLGPARALGCTTDRDGGFVLPAADPALARMTIAPGRGAALTVDVDLAVPGEVTLDGMGILRIERVRAAFPSLR